jgi:hypothetical protein
LLLLAIQPGQHIIWIMAFINHSFLCAPAFTKKGVSNHGWKKGMMGHQ